MFIDLLPRTIPPLKMEAACRQTTLGVQPAMERWQSLDVALVYFYIKPRRKKKKEEEPFAVENEHTRELISARKTASYK